MTKKEVIDILKSLKIKEEDMWYANESNYTNRDLFEAKNDIIDVCIEEIQNYDE